MDKLIASLAAASLLIPAYAMAAPTDSEETRPGAFVGARVQFSLGGREKAVPRAGLTLAPTISRISGGHIVRTRVDDGLSLNFESKLTLTLAGQRADRLLGLKPAPAESKGHKLGLSSGGWVAVGIGVVAIAGGIYFLNLVDEAEDNTD